MTQEQKDLLLKDLCARLSYGVKCLYKNKNIYSLTGIDLKKHIYVFITNNDDLQICEPEIENIKPYLFPISSLTNEQRDDFPFESSLLNAFVNGYISLFEDEELTVDDIIRMMDWFNKKHIDYQGLIPMGLAIDASNLNIYYL